MSQSEERIFYLLQAFTSKTATVTEENELMEWMQKAQEDSELKLYMQSLWSHYDNKTKFDYVNWDNIFEDIMNKQKVHSIVTPSKRIPLTRIAAAVLIFLFLSAGAYFYFSNDPQKQIAKTDTSESQLINDVAPGGNKAVLTLADGTLIVLDSAANGTLSQQGNTKIIKLNNGKLSYNTLIEKPGEVLYNTISTPKGGQYQIVLADGSKVWLNAASSLHFPTSFIGKERNVKLTGEGYFEIAKNAIMPFHVSINGMKVEVLGTHFNVNAYVDEPSVKTTLLEGSVKINTGNTTGLLKPGQQAQVNKEKKLKLVSADIEEAVAWKNGFFSFSNADLQTVLRQLARWYNVEVIYKGNIPLREFKGEMQRDLNLSEALEILEKNNVHYKIDNKTIVVTQ